jgi:hypothetical protein
MSAPRTITLVAFERIDSLLSQQLRAGPFEDCADPRAYIQNGNRLLDACIDAMGTIYCFPFPSAEDCAWSIVTKALLSSTFVVDEEEAAQ